MSDYLPLEMVVPAWILYSLVLISSIVIALLGFKWKAARGKELFTLVCVGVCLTCLDRLVNFTVGYLGFGTSSLVFVILVRINLFFFIL